MSDGHGLGNNRTYLPPGAAMGMREANRIRQLEGLVRELRDALKKLITESNPRFEFTDYQRKRAIAADDGVREVLRKVKEAGIK